MCTSSSLPSLQYNYPWQKQLRNMNHCFSVVSCTLLILWNHSPIMLLWRPPKGYCTHLHFANFPVLDKYENFLNHAWVSCTPLWWRFAWGQHTADNLLRLCSYNILQFSFNYALNNRDRTARMCVQWLNSLLCAGTSFTFLFLQPAYNNCNNGDITKLSYLRRLLGFIHDSIRIPYNT